MVTEEGLAGRPLDLDDLLILRAWWDNGALSLEDAARIVQKAPREVRSKMDDLMSRNLQSKRVELSSIGISDAFGTGTLTVLPPSRITHEARRALAEQILVFVERKGSISRAEAASSFQISIDQAYRTLQQLVKNGKLRKIGKTGSSVQYELNAKTRE